MSYCSTASNQKKRILPMNKVIKQIYESRMVQDADGSKISPFPTAISEESGTILFNLIKDRALHNTIEVGMAYGLSTLYICEAHKVRGYGHHVAIDPYQEKYYKSIGKLNVKRADLDKYFTGYIAPSYSVLPHLLTSDERFDLAFIDGRHNFDYAMVDFFYIDLLLKQNGYLVLDDMWLPQIRKLASFILRNRQYSVVSIPSRQTFRGRFFRFGRRFMQNPMELDYRFKLSPHNILIMQKTGLDTRSPIFHKSF
jgi:predicted O-methyltransferase YrrM